MTQISGVRMRVVLSSRPLSILLALAVLTCGCQSRPSTVQADSPSKENKELAHVAPGARDARPLDSKPMIRATGTVQAVRFHTVLVPQISGQNGRMTLTRLVPNGTRVKLGDILAEFDRVQQVENARTAAAKVDDLTHQIDQKKAEHLSNAAKRLELLRQAEADLAKAQLQLRKGPLLSDIDRAKNEEKAQAAAIQVDSLKKSSAWHEKGEAAAVRILELQRDRHKVNLERTQTNLERLVIKAPLEGMVALENIWRNGSMGPAQEGDQVWAGQPMVRIFDPTHMIVVTSVSEPDGAALGEGVRAHVSLDAYPEARFTALFESASPVASAALGTPLKTFSARFRLEQVDPRLLPDLSAAVDVDLEQLKPEAPRVADASKQPKPGDKL